MGNYTIIILPLISVFFATATYFISKKYTGLKNYKSGVYFKIILAAAQLIVGVGVVFGLISLGATPYFRFSLYGTSMSLIVIFSGFSAIVALGVIDRDSN